MCTLIRYLGFMGNFLVGCYSMIVWTSAVSSVLYACVLYFCICTCSEQLSMFHMERRSRSTLIIITSDFNSGIIVVTLQSYLALWGQY